MSSHTETEQQGALNNRWQPTTELELLDLPTAIEVGAGVGGY